MAPPPPQGSPARSARQAVPRCLQMLPENSSFFFFQPPAVTLEYNNLSPPSTQTDEREATTKRRGERCASLEHRNYQKRAEGMGDWLWPWWRVSGGSLLTSGWERAWWARGRWLGSGHEAPAPARSDQLPAPHWLDPGGPRGGGRRLLEARTGCGQHAWTRLGSAWVEVAPGT